MYLSKAITFCFLAAILGCVVVTAQESSSVALHVFGASSPYWLALQPQNDNGATSQVEWKDANSADFTPMVYADKWGYYFSVAVSGDGFAFPLTIRLIDADGEQITTQLDEVTPGALIHLGNQFASRRHHGGPAHSESSSDPAPSDDETPEDSSAPAEPASGDLETSASPDAQAPPALPAETEEATDLCSPTSTSEEPLKILVPLYVYPGAAWDSLCDAASNVNIIAIVNPNSGPLSSVDSSYSTYMNKLHDAGVEMVGYVHTSYGERSISDVEADINTWVANYPLVTGIFFDEAANDASQISYYTQAYNFVMSKPGYDQVILNPGVQPDQGYLSISTSIVIFENYGSDLAGTNFDSWVTCAPSASEKSGYKYRFSGIAHTTSAGDQAGILSALANKGMGLVYVTDGEGGCCTYNTLVSYFAEEASSVQALN